MEGLYFIEGLINYPMFNEPLQLKALMLMYDFIVYDTSTFPDDPTYIRKQFGNSSTIIPQLFILLNYTTNDEDILSPKYGEMRKYILINLYEIF